VRAKVRKLRFLRYTYVHIVGFSRTAALTAQMEGAHLQIKFHAKARRRQERYLTADTRRGTLKIQIKNIATKSEKNTKK